MMMLCVMLCYKDKDCLQLANILNSELIKQVVILQILV